MTGAARRNAAERRPWTWKTADRSANPRLQMLYEPGNWGDVLKGTWLHRLLDWLAARGGPRPVVYSDPFAGAPTYPLTEQARGRLAELDGLGQVYARRQRRFAERGELASAALLAREVLGEGGPAAQVRLFELDESRRKAWGERAGVSWLEGRDGGEILGRLADERAAAGDGGAPDRLVLVDPYDFLEGWRELLPPALALAERGWVLVYLFNKAPRGSGPWRAYRLFRERLAKAPAFRLGRLPTDAILPRAYHEVLWLGPKPLPEELSAKVREETLRLAGRLAERGAFEAEA